MSKTVDNSSNRTSYTQNKVPLISVITITYNAAGVITPTLESLNNQTFRDFEHLVIDGASKDRTLQVIDRLSTSSIVYSEPDNGLYDAMNKGLARAQGRYMLFLNAGDSLHDADVLGKYARAISQHYAQHGVDPDIVYGDTVIVNGLRQVQGMRHLRVPDRLTFRSFANGMLVCHQAFMVRHDIAPEYDLHYHFSADYEWTLRCLRSADPRHNVNLHAVVIDYLSDGITDKNHKASLRERFNIMCRYYGTVPTILRHIGFLFRALHRKFQ